LSDKKPDEAQPKAITITVTDAGYKIDSHGISPIELLGLAEVIRQTASASLTPQQARPRLVTPS
jgi:hypothetical protein